MGGHEELGKRLAGANPPGGLIQLGVADHSARPAIQQLLGDAWIETLGANGRERVFRRPQWPRC